MPLIYIHDAPGVGVAAATAAGQFQSQRVLNDESLRQQQLAEQQRQFQSQHDLQRQQAEFGNQMAVHGLGLQQQQLNQQGRLRQDSLRQQELLRREQMQQQQALQQQRLAQQAALAQMSAQQRAQLQDARYDAQGRLIDQRYGHQGQLQEQRLGTQAELQGERIGAQREMQDQRLGTQGTLQEDRQQHQIDMQQQRLDQQQRQHDERLAAQQARDADRAAQQRARQATTAQRNEYEAERRRYIARDDWLQKKAAWLRTRVSGARSLEERQQAEAELDQVLQEAATNAEQFRQIAESFAPPTSTEGPAGQPGPPPTVNGPDGTVWRFTGQFDANGKPLYEKQ